MNTQSAFFRVHLVRLMLVTTFLVGCLPARVAQASVLPSNVQPFLAQLAQDDPTDLVRVIIQMHADDATMADKVRSAGGEVVRPLEMIHALVADLPAQAILSVAGQESVRWISLDAPVYKSGEESDGSLQARDAFDTVSFAGNEGSQSFASDWQELGEADGAQEGNVAVTPFWGGALQGLRLQGANMGATRSVDLSAAKSAQVTLAYRRKAMTTAEQFVTVAASGDAGASWHEIGRIGGPATDSEIQYASFDLSVFVGSAVTLQLLTSNAMDENSKLYLDYVNVELTLNPEIAANTSKVYLPLINSGMADAANTSETANADETASPGEVSAAAYSTSNLASTYVKAIGADRVWTEWPFYYTGSNVRIAVIDSGISEHSDLWSGGQSRIVAKANFGPTSSTPDDDYGHGTHVAGIMSGNGARSSGKYMGVAPDSRLVDIKVTDDKGSGSTSNLVAGLQWLLNNKATYNIRIANLSINSSVPDSYLTSPLCAAVEVLWFNGIVVVVSAGNAGGGKLNPPANDPFVITVGSADDQGTASTTDDTLSSFSGYNITEDGFAKPDLLAPGRNIISLLSADDNNLATDHASNKLSGSEGYYYYKMSGTSMASAVVAGAVAILLQKESSLTPDQVKYRLMHTAKSFTTGQPCAAGAGYLDIYAATHTYTIASTNTGIKANQLLWTGSSPVTWSSVNWNSVNWNSVNWNSVNWNSVNWNSVNWNSVNWNSTDSGGASQGNCSDVSSYGLLGQWRLNESSGTIAADASGNKNLGTLRGGATHTAAGRINSAILLDGADDNVAIPSSSTLNNLTNKLTLSAWLYRTSAKTGWQSLIARQYGTGTQDQFSLALSGNSYYFTLNTVNNGLRTATAGSNKLNEWVHVAGVYDGSTMKLYINGALAATTLNTTGNVRLDSKPLYLGAAANGSDPNATSESIAGVVDDLRVYNRALSATEIQTVYKGLTNPGTPLSIYDESLAPAWLNWSWDISSDLANTAAVLSGGKSIALTYNAAWAGFKLHTATPLSTSGFSTLRFRARGGANSSLLLGININESSYSYFVTAYADQWVQLDVPLATFGNPATINDIFWQNKSGTAQPTFYLDQIELVP